MAPKLDLIVRNPHQLSLTLNGIVILAKVVERRGDALEVDLIALQAVIARSAPTAFRFAAPTSKLAVWIKVDTLDVVL